MSGTFERGFSFGDDQHRRARATPLSKPKLRLVRDLLALYGGELAGKVVGFAAFAYLARVLEPKAYGSVEVAVALSLFFALVIDLGLGPIGAREIARDPAIAKRLAAQIPAARSLLALFAIPLMGISAVAMGQPRQTVYLVWLYALALLAAPWMQRWLFQGLEMMAWISVGQVIRMMAFAMGVVIWVRGPGDLMRVGFVEIGAAAAVALYFLSVQHLRVTPVRIAFDSPALGRLMGEGLPVGLGQIVWALNQYLPTLLVAYLLGREEIAWFGAAHRIVISLATFAWLYHFNLFPAVCQSLAESTEALSGLVRLSFRATAWISFFVVLLTSLAAGPICRLAFGPAFEGTAAPLSVLLWTLPAIALAGHARFALIANGQQFYVLISQVAGVGTTLLVGLALIPSLGALGGAVAMLVSLLVVWAVAHAYASRLIAPMPFLGSLLRPGAAALGAAGLGWAVGGASWLGAAIAGVSFAACAPAVDGALIRDLRRLAELKGEVQTPRQGAPGR